MKNIEVINELRCLVKPYIGIMKQNKFSAYCIRIEKGTCKPKTVDDFLDKFGYFGTWNCYKKKNPL